MKFLDQKQKDEFLALLKSTGKKPGEIAAILGVSVQHLSGALPLNPRKKEIDKDESNKKEIKVPAKWYSDFKKELELMELRKLKEKVDNLTGDKND